MGTVHFEGSVHLLNLRWFSTMCCYVLRHCATSRKVAGSIPDEVIGFFNWPNPSNRTMALGSTQPLTGVPGIFLGGKGLSARKADLISICEPIFYKMWEPRCLTTLWASMACYKDSWVVGMSKWRLLVRICSFYQSLLCIWRSSHPIIDSLSWSSCGSCEVTTIVILRCQLTKRLGVFFWRGLVLQLTFAGIISCR
jgi:hypothetical protein